MTALKSLFAGENWFGQPPLKSAIFALIILSALFLFLYGFFFWENWTNTSWDRWDDPNYHPPIGQNIIPLFLILLLLWLIFVGYRIGLIFGSDKKSAWYWFVIFAIPTFFSIAGGFMIGKIKTNQWLKKGKWNNLITLVIAIGIIILEIVKNAFLFFGLLFIGILPGFT